MNDALPVRYYVVDRSKSASKYSHDHTRDYVMLISSLMFLARTCALCSSVTFVTSLE